MKKIVLLFLLTLPLLINAARIRDIEFSIDSSNFGRTNQFEITVNLIKKNGKRVVLKPNVFSFHWSKVKVEGEHILSFSNGKVIFDQVNINASNRLCNFKVSYDMGKKGKHYQEKVVNFPYITNIELENEFINVNTPSFISLIMTFNNNIKSYNNESLFKSSTLELLCKEEIVVSNNSFYLKLNDPANFDSLNVQLINKKSGEIFSEKKLPLKYPTTVSIFASGNNGENGISGKNGVNYSQDGKNGTSAYNGENAQEVKVFVEVKELNGKTYFKITSFFTNKIEQVDIIEFKNAPIEIYANGGNGGNGGHGGSGQIGKIDLAKKIISPKGGNGGNGGNSGNGGNGGQIEIYFVKNQKDVNHYFIGHNLAGIAGEPGKGGNGGKGDYVNSTAKDKKAEILDGKSGRNGYSGKKGLDGKPVLKSVLIYQEFNDKIASLRTK